MAYNVGLVGPYDYDGVIQNDFFASMAIWMFERHPLVARLPNVPTSASVLKAVDDAYRPNSTIMTDANGITNATNAITTSDAPGFMLGDMLQIDDEIVVVSAAPTSSSTSLTINRAQGGTTAVAHNANSTVYLIGNTRTGAEVDQDAPTRVFDNSATYPQVFQHPWQIGGSLEARSANMSIPLGFGSLVGYQKAKAAFELMDDAERSCYYSQAAALASDTTRPSMRGLRQRISTNRVTLPSNASAYKPTDFERDFLSAAVDGGGKPDLLVLSTKYRLAFQMWGINLEQLFVGDTSIGLDISVFKSPALGGVQVVFSPLLRSYHGFSVTSMDLKMAWVREPRPYPRGRRGDADEGDVIGEGTIVINNETHHAWVEGVTGFAKQS